MVIYISILVVQVHSIQLILVIKYVDNEAVAPTCLRGDAVT